MVLHLHLFRIARPTLNGVFHHRLPLESLGPTRHGDGCRMSVMRLIARPSREYPRRGKQTAREQRRLQAQHRFATDAPAF